MPRSSGGESSSIELGQPPVRLRKIDVAVVTSTLIARSARASHCGDGGPRGARILRRREPRLHPALSDVDAVGRLASQLDPDRDSPGGASPAVVDLPPRSVPGAPRGGASCWLVASARIVALR